MASLTIRLPSVAGFSPSALSAPREIVYQFNSAEDLLRIEDVRRWALDDDFSGYEVRNGYLMACYCGKQVAAVGKLSDPNHPAIADLPRRKIEWPR